MDPSRLAPLTLFDCLDAAALGRCAALFQEAEILAGTGLTREGDFAYKFFVLLEGEAEVLRDFDHVANLTAGDFFGEMGVVAATKRNARVVPTTNCHVAWVMAWDFKTMTDEFPVVTERINAAIARRSGVIN